MSSLSEVEAKRQELLMKIDEIVAGAYVECGVIGEEELRQLSNMLAARLVDLMIKKVNEEANR